MSEWISVEERLPAADTLVLTYTPPQPGDYPDDIRYEFDFIDSDTGDWYHHGEHYEHYLAVAPPASQGPSEKAKYTHWMPLPEPPK